jgi:hypothetical protein
MSPLKRIFSGFMAMIVGCVMLWQAIAETHKNHRLAVNPHERARVEDTWTSSGKHSARYADLAFANAAGGSLCHAKQVRLGPSTVPASVGQWIDIVPIPGSCEAPDAPSDSTPNWLLALQFVFAFGAFAGGGMRIAGAPMPFARSATRSGYARL